MMESKALFFLNSFVGGGAEKICINLAKQLYEQNIGSDFVTVYNSRPDYDIPNWIQTYSLGLTDPFLTRFSIIKCIPEVNKFISNKNYVLITAHLNPAQYLASLTKAGKKCLYVMHVTQKLTDQCNSWFYKRNLQRFTIGKKIVTVSKGLETELYTEYDVNLENITTIYNPCSIETLEQETKRNVLHNRPYILFVGRLEEQKNPLLALELYNKGQFYKEYDFIFIGKGGLEASIRKRVVDYQLKDYVFLEGFQKKPEQWIKNAALLLACSKQEGLSMNLIEALICGTPVVAADCPYGPKEVLTDELAPYLIYPEKKFEESISVIWSALKDYPKITEKYYKKFDGKLIIQEYLRLWRECFGTELMIR
jgi:glycosyltransferase involved in cell wall biosynthesis